MCAFGPAERGPTLEGLNDSGKRYKSSVRNVKGFCATLPELFRNAEGAGLRGIWLNNLGSSPQVLKEEIAVVSLPNCGTASGEDALERPLLT